MAYWGDWHEICFTIDAKIKKSKQNKSSIFLIYKEIGDKNYDNSNEKKSESGMAPVVFQRFF